MIGHGAIILFLGLVSGYLFAFNLVEEITLWPIPGTLDVRIPGSPERWRAAHSGNIMNALMIIAAALSPARVSSVEVVDPRQRAARVVVPDYQLSLAIGREGQNARLAAKLTGWRIDIRPDTPPTGAGDAPDRG